MLQIQRTIGEKGQVVLPKDIRQQFNLRKGSHIFFTVKDDEIVLKPGVDPKKYVQEFFEMGRGVRKRSPQEFKRLLEKQYDNR